MKIGFIGLGKYGSALAQALIDRAGIKKINYLFYDIDTSRTEPFKQKNFKCENSWEDIVREADVIIYGLPSTSHMAFEFAHDISLKLEKINKPRLLVRMDTLVRPMNHEEAVSKVSIIRIIFGLSIKCADAPIAVLQLGEEAADASQSLANEFINVLNKIGIIFEVDDCHGLLLFRFLVGTMMIPIAQDLASPRSGCSENIALEIFKRLLGDGEKYLQAYNQVKDSTTCLINKLHIDVEKLITEIKSPGGLTEFLWPYLTPWPCTKEMIEDFVGRIKSKLCDFENRLIGVSLIASSRMVEQDLHLKPLPKTNINESIEEATRRIANYLGIYCHFWPNVFSYFSLVDNNARRVNVVHRRLDDRWFTGVINQWFIGNYSDGTILVSPQRFLRKLYGYAQLAMIHGMIPSDSSEYCFPKGMIDRDLGVLLDLDVACIVRDRSVIEIVTKIVKNEINPEEFMSWLEKFSPGKDIKNIFNANFINMESTEYIIDSVIRYCIWIIGAAAKSNITWGNIFIPFSHRNALPVSLHVGIRRWIGAEQLSCLQSILSAFFMPPLEQDRHDKAMHAASAAILARNFSHHIGSHVIPRAMVRDIKTRLNTLYENGTKNESELDKSDRISRSVERLKAALDDFIQKKADFLAEVTTDPNSSSDSKRLGQDILAPLMRNALFMDNIARTEGFGYPSEPCPLAAILKKKTMENYWRSELTGAEKEKIIAIDSDVNIDNKDETILLAQLQMRMRSTLKISLCISDKDENDSVGCRCILGPELPAYDPLYGFERTGFEPEQFGVFTERVGLDPMISVPGMVGQYAIYGILENIIRNAAKHTKKEDKNIGLHIHMHIEEEGEDYYRLSIWDDRTDPDMEITAPIPNQPGVKPERRALFNHLQCWAEADLIDPSGAVRRDAWGVAEIVICANLLAGRRQFDYQPEIVKIEGTKKIEGTNQSAKRLIYRIRLLKAKRAVLIGETFTDNKNRSLNTESLKKEGIYAFTSVDELREYFQKSQACQAFQFAVFDRKSLDQFDRYTERAREEFFARLPFRIFCIASPDDDAENDEKIMKLIPRAVCLKNNPFNDAGDSPAADAIMELLWRRWVHDNKDLNPLTRNITNIIYLDVKKDESPHTDWAKVIPAFNSKRDNPVHIYLESSDQADKTETEKKELGADFLSNGIIRTGFLRHKTAGGITHKDMFEVFSKRSADCDLILAAALPTADRPFWELPYRMAEAGLVRILVLDERMAERAMVPLPDRSEFGVEIRNILLEDNNYIPCFWHLACQAKVYIATHLQVGNDDMAPLHESFEKKESKIKGASTPFSACPCLKIKISNEGLTVLEFDRYGPNKQNNASLTNIIFDIIVIHQGIIDTFKPKMENGNGEETMRQWIAKTHPWLVVESGRGIPPGLQKKPIRFLSFSVLDQAMNLDGIGKFMLTRRLMALPRFSDNGGES